MMQVPILYQRQMVERGYIKQGKDFEVDNQSPEFWKFKDSEDYYWIATNLTGTKVTFV